MAARATSPGLLMRLAQQIRAKIPRANRLLAFPSHADVNPELMRRIEELATLRTTPLSLLDLYRFGKTPTPIQRLRNAQFLHMELPRRIAQRIVELQQLPNGLAEMTGIQNVIGWYAGYVDELLAFTKPTNAEEEHDFTCLLASILCDHTSVPRALAAGMKEYRADMSIAELVDDPTRTTIETILTNFYTARIGIRFLVEHHIVSNDNREGYSGIIASNCSPQAVAQHAAQDAERLCRHALGAAPPIRLIGKPEDVFCYVPSHLNYMISETLKNACRAVVEKHHPAYRGLPPASDTHAYTQARMEARRKASLEPQAEIHLPPIKVIAAMGEEDVTIKVADEGGGVARSDLPLLWTFFYTTAPQSLQEVEPMPNASIKDAEKQANNNPSHLWFPQVGTEPVLAGHGMGLPLSRIYARYFGGDLQVKSLEGFGMDSYLHLCKLGDRCEDLGLQVMCSPAGRDSTT